MVRLPNLLFSLAILVLAHGLGGPLGCGDDDDGKKSSDDDLTGRDSGQSADLGRSDLGEAPRPDLGPGQPDLLVPTDLGGPPDLTPDLTPDQGPPPVDLAAPPDLGADLAEPAPDLGPPPTDLALPDQGPVDGGPWYVEVEPWHEDGGHPADQGIGPEDAGTQPPPLVLTLAELPPGQEGQPYEVELTHTGGEPPVTCAAAGLPEGLELDPDECTLRGVPLVAGTFEIELLLEDAAGQTAEATLPLVIEPSPLVLLTDALPAGQEGLAYAEQLLAAGGTRPYRWFGQGLPAGLALDPLLGLLAGTPLAQGRFPVRVRVVDDAGAQVERELPLDVTGPGLQVIRQPLPPAQVGVQYQATLQASGGTAPYRWQVAGLPPGLVLDPATGTLSGTPESYGQFTLLVHVQDEAGHQAELQLELEVRPGLLRLVTDRLPDGRVAEAYALAVEATGGRTPYTFQAAGLPAGLSINEALGLLAGQPVAAGRFAVTLTVVDIDGRRAWRELPLQIHATPLALLTRDLPAGLLDAAYTRQLEARGGQPPYRFEARGLPWQLAADPATGLIAGTPREVGTFPVQLAVTDAAGQRDAADALLTVVPPPLLLLTRELPEARTGYGYSIQLEADGGVEPYLFEAQGLPAGLSVDPATGLLGGMPTAAAAPGNYPVRLTVRDAAGQVVEAELLLILRAAALVILTDSLPQAATGTPYLAQAEAAGGRPPYRWSMTAHPSLSLTIDPATGRITGLPRGMMGFDQYPIRLTATDGANQTVSRELTLTLVIPPLTFALAELPNAFVGREYQLQLVATGGAPPYQWNEAGLPQGLMLDTQTGLISGIPTRTAWLNVQLQVMDTRGGDLTVTRQLKIFAEPLLLTTEALPRAHALTDYSVQLTAAGGRAPYRWSCANLPPGLMIAPFSGLVSGMLAQVGTHELRVQVEDDELQRTVRVLTLEVLPQLLRIGTTELPEARVGEVYQAHLDVMGGVEPYTFQVAGLPAGLVLDAPAGNVVGQPRVHGEFTIRLTVADGSGQQAVQELALRILPGVLTLTLQGLPEARAGEAYQQQLRLTGGVAPYTYTAAGLPAGLTLDEASGLLGGTPTVYGTFDVTLAVTSGDGQQVRQVVRLTVRPPRLVLSLDPLPAGRVGEVYAATLQAAGGVPPWRWNAAELPPGLLLDPLTGVLTGKPTTYGHFNPRFQVTDAEGQTVAAELALTLAPTAPRIVTAALPPARVGEAYTFTPEGAGGAPPWRWSGQGLPAGLLQDGATGALSGAPTQRGTFAVTLRATDDWGQQVSRALELQVEPPWLKLDVASLAAGRIGERYLGAARGTGGVPPYRWVVAGLPQALTLDGATGLIEGIPASFGLYPLQFTVDDSGGQQVRAEAQLRIWPPRLSITTAALPPGETGAVYSQAAVAAGGAPPYRWAARNLPQRLRIDAATGVIAGLLTQDGVFQVVLQATDMAGQQAERTLPLTVAAGPLMVVADELPLARRDLPYEALLEASGGVQPYRWTLDNPLPPGLAFEANPARVHGTPTQLGLFELELLVEDAARTTARQTVLLEVAPRPPEVVTRTLAEGLDGIPYRAALTGELGAPPYTWSVAAGNFPEGLELGADGVLAGVPARAGVYDFTVRLIDQRGEHADAPLRLTILAVEPPEAIVVATPARLPLLDDFQTVVTLDASRSTGRALTYTWTVPDGRLEPGSRLDDPALRVRFAGDRKPELLLRVANPRGVATTLIEVPVNRPPLARITGTALGQVQQASDVHGRTSSDADGDPLTYRWQLLDQPAGSAARLTTPAAATPGLVPDLPGSYSLELVVADGLNQSAPALFRVLARPPELDPPQLVVGALPMVVAVGTEVRICAQAQDASPIRLLQATVDGVALPLGPNGCGNYLAAAAGRYPLAAYAEDEWRNSAWARGELFVQAGADNGSPTVALTAPGAGSILSGLTEFVGTADDADLAVYRIEAARPGQADWQPLVEGTTAVRNGVLGVVNPGQLIPGVYRIRLCAFDTFGHGVCTPAAQYEFGDGPAPSALHFLFTDATLEPLGVPIHVNRVYDSRDLSAADFGHGWTMQVEGFGGIEEMTPPAEGWSEGDGCFNLPFKPTIIEDAPHTYTVRLGSAVYRFRLVPTPTACGWGYFQLTLAFRALPGTTATLRAPDIEGTVYAYERGSGQLVEGDLFTPLEISNFTLDTPEGLHVELHRDRGVTLVRDPLGNTITMEGGRIRHSGGMELTLARDAQGRLTSITEPDGRVRRYTYDERGDLATTTDGSGTTTRFLYDGHHRLQGILDPRGGVPGMLEYDAEGRLVAMIDPAGRRIEFENDFAGRSQRILDRLGNVTLFFYDAQGRVIKKVDALGRETVQTWDAAGRLASVTDPSGAVIRYEYDAAGNLTATTDPLGHRWTTGYDATGRVTAEADPLGNTLRWEYTPSGQLAAETDARGNRAEYTYDARGALATAELPEGTRFTFGSDADGRMTSFTDGVGRQTSLAWSRRGEVTSDTLQVTLDGQPQTVRFGYDYNDRASLTQVVGPDGSVARVRYDADGLPLETIGPDGATQRLEFDSSGRVGAMTMPDGGRLQVQYDGEDRPTQVQLPDGSVVRAELDPAGGMTRLRLPGGNTFDYLRDEGGRVTGMQDGAGRTTTYEYDVAGRVSRLRFSDGSGYRYTRDEAGRLTAVEELNTGARTTATYDEDGHVLSVTLPGGGQASATYNEAGDLAGLQMASGLTLSYEYDDAGRLTGVTDSLGQTTRYVHNALNELEQVTSPAGRAQTFRYDLLGRLRQRAGAPLSGAESYEYDEGGQPVRTTTPTGVVVETAYDASGRWVSRSGGEGTEEHRSYNDGGQVREEVTPWGSRQFLYDGASRLVRVSQDDGLFVGQGYDDRGRVLAVATAAGETRYEWNDADRLAAVQDAEARLTYGYDASGRLAQGTLPGPVTLGFEWDLNGRASRMAGLDGRGGTRFEERYTRDPAGRITRADGPQGAVTYEYDPVGRLREEVRPDRTLTYAYDADGNLTRLGDRLITHDPLGRAITVGGDEQQWDAAGRLVYRRIDGVDEEFTYDPYGRLERIDRTGGLPAELVLTYDTENLLVRVALDGEVRQLLWDRSGALPLLLEEDDEDGVPLVRYIWGPGGLVGLRTGDGAWRSVQVDTRGSVRGLYDAAGQLVARADYLAYGEDVAEPDPALRDGIGFSGQWRLPGTNLYYMRARFYDPRMGRFLTPDPDAPDLRNPLGQNTYMYGQSDPVNHLDPTGRFSMGEVNMVCTIINIVATIALSFFDSPEKLVLNALGLGDILKQVTTLQGVTAAAGWSGLAKGKGNMGWGLSGMLGIGIYVGLDAYFTTREIGLWISIDPYMQFGGAGKGIKAAPKYGFIIGKTKPIKAGFDWEATSRKITATVSSAIVLGKLAGKNKGRLMAILRWVQLHVSGIELAWEPAKGLNGVQLFIRGQMTATKPTARWKSLKIGVKFKWTLLKIDASGITIPDNPLNWSGTSWDDLYNLLAEYF